jgi:cardiolipin synthase
MSYPLVQVILRLNLLAVSLLAIACAPGEIEPPIGEAVSEDPVLEALEAYSGNGQYFLRYRRAEDTYYATGELPRNAVANTAAETAQYDVPAVVGLAVEPENPWQTIRQSLRPVPILGIDDWARFRDLSLGEFIPRDGNQGVVVSFDRLDYFFFYDKSGLFRARRFIDKPADYSVAAYVDLREYFAKWQPMLVHFLEERGIQSGDVLFNTGDLEPGAIPFIYVNTRTRVIVLVRYDELPPQVAADFPANHMLQTFWHFLESHSYSVPMRPFSSIQGLLSLVSDTALEYGRNLLPDLPPAAEVPPLADGPPMDLQQWEQSLDRALGRPASSGRLDFLVGGPAFFNRFIDTVTSATDSIDIRAYIFDNDDVALEIAQLLKRRSREGLRVRVLYDGLGSIMAGGESSQSLPEDHRAPFSIEAFLKQDSRVAVRTVKNTWLRGDHVKTMVIDRRLAFLGGMNIGREYRYDWHDLMVEVTGPIVDEINHEFEAAWAQAGWWGDFGMLFSGRKSRLNRELAGYPVRLIHTGPQGQEIYELQRQAIRSAQRYIYIENAYFTDDVLLKELVLARRRGVDVRVIIPLETDRGLITRNIAFAANRLYQNGVRVYIYPGFTHAKAAVFDGWASVGTANLDRLSLKINREINIATSETRAVEELITELFQPDFERSVEMQEPFPAHWSDHLIEMMGDYIF